MAMNRARTNVSICQNVLYLNSLNVISYISKPMIILTGHFYEFNSSEYESIKSDYN